MLGVVLAISFHSFIVFNERSLNSHSRPGSILGAMDIIRKKRKACLLVGDEYSKGKEKGKANSGGRGKGAWRLMFDQSPN